MFDMAASNEFPDMNRGRGRGYRSAQWLEGNKNRRRTVGQGQISGDEVVEEVGKRSTGTQTEEQERPVCVVRPNNHLRTGGAPAGMGIARGQYIGL